MYNFKGSDSFARALLQTSSIILAKKKNYYVIMFDAIDTAALLSFRGCTLFTITNLALKAARGLLGL